MAEWFSPRASGERLQGEARGTREKDLVGAKGFEPSTPASRTQCATGLRYAPTRRLTKNGNRIVLQDGGKTQAMCFSHSGAGHLAVFYVDTLR